MNFNISCGRFPPYRLVRRLLPSLSKKDRSIALVPNHVVVLDGALLVGPKVTGRACEGLVPRVDEHVSLHVVGAGEHFAAVAVRALVVVVFDGFLPTIRELGHVRQRTEVQRSLQQCNQIRFPKPIFEIVIELYIYIFIYERLFQLLLGFRFVYGDTSITLGFENI